MSRSLAAVAAALITATTTTTTTTSTQPIEVRGDRVEVVALDGTVLRIGDKFYQGPLVVNANSNGVSVLESLPPETYLLGIREVPFDWPSEALKTQAVAARTYLAFTLASGRSTSGRENGYDICVTTSCQVYAGVAGLNSSGGERWRRAVADTAGEILLFDGHPAQALYSSTAGTRTRESEDIFPGLNLPYLRAVDSPDEPSPFVDWSFSVSDSEMAALLTHAELVAGPLWSVVVQTTEDGEGPWQVEVASGTQVESVPSYRFRSLINRAAADLMPDRLPAERPDGRRYPQTVLSGTYTIKAIPEVVEHPGYREIKRRYLFEGHGWGHQVGMSQFGALAMARAGAGYSEILAHYYGGLVPQPAGGWLPEQITVGLVVANEEAVIAVEEGATVLVDGEAAAPVDIGIWRFRSDGGNLVTQVPTGIGQPPLVRASRITVGSTGPIVRFQVTAPGFLEVTVTQKGQILGQRSFGLIEAGPFEYNLGDLLDNEIDKSVPFRVSVSINAPRGNSASRLTLVPER